MKKEKSEADVILSLEALCVTGEHCLQEMRDKMYRWGVDKDVQERILTHLVENRFVDEERYARAFVKDKARYNKWGSRKIEQALWAKHIPESIIREALNVVEPEEYVATLRALLKNRKRAGSGSYEDNLRLVRFALGRGFTMDIIRQCIDTDYDKDID